MIPTLAAAEPAILLSIYKPILFVVVVAAWGLLVTKLGKDVSFHFPTMKESWNGVQIGAGITGLVLWLMLPWFWAGLALFLLCMGGGFLGYTLFRNPRLDEDFRWTFSIASFTKPYEDAADAKAQAKATVHLVGPDGGKLDVPTGESPYVEAHRAFEQAIEFAVPRAAQRIELLAEPAGTAMAVQIDGVRYPQPTLDAKTGLLMIDYIKLCSKLDVADRRKKQTGKMTIDAGAMGRHAAVVNTSGTTRGLSLTVDLNPAGGKAIPFEKLGLLEPQRQALDACLKQPGRVVMVVCPPSQGMTTTLYSLLTHHDPYTQSVVTIEEDVPFELEGVIHNRMDAASDINAWNQKLKGLLLRETNVVMLGKVSDPSTCKLIADNVGATRFYFGLKQDDSFAALRAWVKAVGDTQTAAGALGAIIGQRLIRKLCTNCRVSYKPDPDTLRKLNLPADRISQMYKHSGKIMVKEKETECPDCVGVGYKGRVGVFEALTLDDEARKLIAAGQLEQLKTHLRRQRTLWLQEAALAKAVEGVTSISEITRVFAKEPPKAGA